VADITDFDENGNPNLMISVNVDINQCVKTFEMLQQSEMKYSKVFNE